MVVEIVEEIVGDGIAFKIVTFGVGSRIADQQIVLELVLPTLTKILSQDQRVNGHIGICKRDHFALPSSLDCEIDFTPLVL